MCGKFLMWQIQSAHAQLERKDVITVSPTGSGKTMMFWIPMLFNASGIMIIITPLNILGEKTEVEGNLFGIPAVNLTAKTATDKIFKEIEAFKYQIIAVSPERILKDPHFQDLFKSSKFMNRLFNITVDKGHCISEWGDVGEPSFGCKYVWSNMSTHAIL
ncbi:hypothetical protein BS17DRAFT_767951 [Gyrodon lividus]|nr:hypothetical protein BS17DRAFT_767951 [Gyrodon lividus]